MPEQPTAELRADLAQQARRLGALVADLIGQAMSATVPVPTEMFSVQPLLLAWARQLERSAQWIVLVTPRPATMSCWPWLPPWPPCSSPRRGG